MGLPRHDDIELDEEAAEVEASELNQTSAPVTLNTSTSRLVEETILHYESLIFQMSLSLTGSEQCAAAVVKEVFERIYEQGVNLQDLSCETLIHSYTYDIALQKLVQRITDCTYETDVFGEENLEGPKVLH